jgi:hypothetical protein
MRWAVAAPAMPKSAKAARPDRNLLTGSPSGVMTPVSRALHLDLDQGARAD